MTARPQEHRHHHRPRGVSRSFTTAGWMARFSSFELPAPWPRCPSSSPSIGSRPGVVFAIGSPSRIGVTGVSRLESMKPRNGLVDQFSNQATLMIEASACTVLNGGSCPNGT